MKKLRKERRFLFTDDAVGFNGLMKSPREMRIESQAVSSLAVGGGVSTARVENIRFGEFVSIKSAETAVVGKKVEVERADGSRVRVAQAAAAATLEGFNMLNVVRAGYMSARISADHPDNGEDPEITTLGTGFDDLWIAGRRVEIEYDESVLRLLKFSDLPKNLEALKVLRDCWKQDRRDLQEIDGTKFEDIQGELNDERSVNAWMKQLRAQGPIACSIVKEVHGLPKGVEVQPYPRQHVLYVPGFGEIVLGEMLFTAKSRRLTLMRMDLGCGYGGCGCSGDVCDNGSWHP